MHTLKHRPAFTIVEILVAMAVFIILLSLGFPALQRMRIQSTRFGCQNNLRQIGMGLLGYAETNYAYPPAYSGQGYNPGWGWGAFILPQVDQSMLFQTAGVGNTVFGGGSNPAYPTSATQTKIPLFRCPAETAPDLNPVRLDFALSNYRAIAGPTTYPYFSANHDTGGVFFQNSKVDPIDILDGQSNTLAIGECIYDEPTGKRAALWAGMTGLRDGAIWISDVTWWIDDSSARINGDAPQAFSSRHGRGANFLFCDGSVRFLWEGGDIAVIKYLAGRADGVVISFPD